MQKRNLVLTGFMGTGKTTVGRLLAARLDYEFVDTDALIVARDGRSIFTIFKEEGESAFRAWETLVSEELAAQEGLVVATGGGLMVNEINATLLKESGFVVCLTASPETIVARALEEGEQRPLLNVSNPAQRIQELLMARADVYGRFRQIPTDGKSPQTIADEIARLFCESF